MYRQEYLWVDLYAPTDSNDCIAWVINEDKVLLFGVIPFPLLPLDKLLPEMHRVLKPGATMSVWLFPPLVHNWIPKAIIRSNLFEQINKQGNVYNFSRI